MISTVLKNAGVHWKVVVLTFEIFWVGVFLLDALSSAARPEAMQFVYANF